MTTKKSLSDFTSAAQIHADLRALQKMRSHLIVQPSLYHGKFSSLLLLCDLEAKEFIIDGLNPVMGNQFLVPGTKVHIQGSHDGIAVEFSSQVVNSGNIPSLDKAHVLKFPERIHRRQRRGSYRTPIKAPFNQQALVVLKRPGDLPELHGYITDISSDGFGCEFPTPPKQPLAPNERLQVQLLLDEQLTIPCSATARQFKPSDSLGFARAGIQIHHMHPVNQRRLEQRLSRWQRHYRRQELEDILNAQLRAHPPISHA